MPHVGASGGSIPFLVAAVGAPDEVKAVSNYVCDGTADEVEINAAIADAGLAGDGHTVIQLSVGTFNISGPLDYLNALYGAPGGSGGGASSGRTIVKVNTAIAGYALTADEVRDMAVVIDGVAVSGAAIELYKAMRNVGVSISAAGSFGTGVTVYGTDTRVSDCHVANGASVAGFDIQTSGKVTFTGVVVEQGGDGILVNAATRLAVSGCVFSGLTGTGIDASGAAPKMAVAGCLFATMSIGIDNTGGGALNTGAASANTFSSVTTPVA